MSDLKEKLQQRLARSRSVHQELIQPMDEPSLPPQAPEQAPSSEDTLRAGRPAKLKRKVTTLYFDEDLDKALEVFLLRQYLDTGVKISKSEWIRRLVETSLRERDAWPPKTKI